MKTKYLLALAAPLMASCAGHWNDIAHEEVVASITAFAVQEQAKCTINALDKNIALVLPYDADPKAVTVSEFAMTEGARCTPEIKVGDKLDVSSPITLTLTTYDDYVWTLSAVQKPKPLSDIYNMNFDLWSKDWGIDAAYGEDADDEQKAVWGTGGFVLALSMGGTPVMTKETEALAVEGEGKAAVKLQTIYSEPLSILGNGTIFTGSMVSFSEEEFKVKLGTPYKKRPVTMDGYARYIPKTIDHAADAYTDKMGTLDNASIFIALADWDSPYEVDPPTKIQEGTESIPGIIGYGKFILDRETDGYEKFSIKLNYLSDRTPTFAVIMASSSALGDYGTGAAGSVLYLDELGFTYE